MPLIWKAIGWFAVAVGLLAPPVSFGQGVLATPKPLFREFMGLNVHTVQFKPELYQPVTKLLRDYHGYDWDVGAESDYAPRFPLARNGVDWESLYGSWRKAGYSTDACLMFDGTLPPQWKDLEHDAHAYGLSFAQFFGPSGRRRLVEAVEIGNEPGKYDDASYRKLFASAARGMREGDPKLLVATCATFARASGPYHKDIAVVKGLEPLYDVINVHSYPELEGYPTWRRSFPEDPRLAFLKEIQGVIDWRNANAPGKQVWLTEFGWDATTQPQAKEGDFKAWVGVTDVQQAQYVVRGLLVLAELDLDRAYVFWFNDNDEASVHASSGLTRRYQPKPSYYAVAHLLSTLGDYRFHRAVKKSEGELYVYEFQSAAHPAHRIWAAWSPTGEGKSRATRLKLSGQKIVRAERSPLQAGPAEPATWTAIGDDEIEIQINETPMFLWLE